MTGPRLGSRLWWGVVPLLVLLWGTGSLTVASLPGLPESGFATLLAVPLAAFARDVALAIAAGAVAVLLLGSPTAGPRVRRWALGWGVVGLGLVGASATSWYAEISAGTDDRSGLWTALTGSLAGRAVLVQAACLAVALLILAVSSARGARGVALGLMLVALGAPGFAGHAGLSGPHAAAAVAVALHVAAIALWMGGLAVVVGLLLIEPDEAPAVLPRYSTLALVCVIIGAEAGLLTASLNTGSLGDLLGSTYGSLVLVKMALLAWLIRLGWLQRRRAVDRLPDASVPSTVARLAAVELTIMGVALAAAVTMARIGPPPVSMTGFAPLSLVAIGLGLPMVVLLAWPRGWRVADALPEAAAVVFLVLVVEVGGVGLLHAILGQVGLLLEVILLGLAGWAALAAARSSAGAGALTLIIGFPLAMTAVGVLAEDPVPVRMLVIAAVVGEALLAAWWWARRSAMTSRETPEVPVVVAG